ncbi:MAG: anti-sigma regulatory factor [Clostridia bacterium]|nr:anti-sigma regulatory factor [Clostridia bacterium]
MSEPLRYTYPVNGDDFMSAGGVSAVVKKTLRELGFDKDIIRRTAIAMYEGEINMVIHANGGVVDVEIYPDRIEVALKDTGPGIADVELAMSDGYSTAPDNVRSLGFGAGMGLPNIKKYSDEMRIETQVGVGTTVYLTIYTKPKA